MSTPTVVKVVVKYHDHVELPDTGATLPLDRYGARLWRDAESLFNGRLRIGRLFADVLGEKLDALKTIAVRQADHRDGATGAGVATQYSPPAFENYLWVSFEPESNDEQEAVKHATEFINHFLKLEGIQYAYIRRDDVPASPPSPPTGLRVPRRIGDIYFRASPDGLGIDTVRSQRIPGATGENQTVVDIEYGWFTNHPALLVRGRSRITVDASTDLTKVPKERWSHGTRTLGLLCGGSAVVAQRIKKAPGIAAGVQRTEVISTWSDDIGTEPTATLVVKAAANRLEAILNRAESNRAPTSRNSTDKFILNQSTVILIELVAQLPDQAYSYPVEIYPDTFDAIQLVTKAQITVVEPAGNGRWDPRQTDLPLAVDLDALAAPPFLTRTVAMPFSVTDRPEGKTNPIKSLIRPAEGASTAEHRQGEGLAPFADSGAIMVAAADPGTKSNAYWTRKPDSNYGSRIDCFAQGVTVTTLEYYAPAPDKEDFFYTDGFDGTSAASAIIAGAALCVQGIAQAKLGSPLLAKRLRAALSNADCGTKSAKPTRDTVGNDRIGTMPDVMKVVKKYVP